MFDKHDEAPQRFTIDDLPFLEITRQTTRGAEIMQALNAGDEQDDNAIRARRTPGELIGLPWTSDECPVVGAEIQVAKGDDSHSLEHLARRSRFVETLMHVANNTRTPAEALVHLATTHPQMVISQVAAANPSLPAWAMDVVFETGTFAARTGLMIHPEAPAHLIDRASQDPEAELRMWAAACRRADVAVLSRLAGDPVERVRAACAINPALPVHLMDGLAVDPCEDVVIALVLNVATPPAVFDAVTDRALRGGRVAAHAAGAAGLTSRSAHKLLDAGVGMYSMARNEAAPPDALARIYRYGGASLRCDVVSNTACPHGLRARAAREDTSPLVRQYAAMNLPPGHDPRVYATAADLTPGRTVLLEKGAATHLGHILPLAESFLLDIHQVTDAETRDFINGDGEPDSYQVATVTGIRRRLNGRPAKRYPDPVTYSVLVCKVRLPDREADPRP